MHLRNTRISIAVAAALGSANALAAGSVVFDNTLPGQPHGTTTTVPLTGGHYTIDASNTGYLSNTNLFESFATFSVGAGEQADFTNSTHLSINNVISRVTGSGSPNGLQPTTIDGNLVSTIAGANFWFINPAGVTIGAGAQINVPAGLAIGTSDFIQFADNSRWYAIESTAPTASVLATASPTAFGFLPTPATGAISLTNAKISTPGAITITSAGPLTIQNSEISSETFTNTDAGGVTLTSNGAVTIVGGRIASGTALQAPPMAGDNGGGGNVSITGPSVLVSGATIESLSQGHTPAGLVSITATAGQGVGPASGGTGDAILITHTSHINSSDAIHASQPAGGISVQATAGSVRIDSGSTVGVNATDYGPLTVSGATGVTLDAAHLSAASSFRGGTVTHAGISLQSQGPISIVNGTTIQSTTEGLATGDGIAIQTSSALTIAGNSQLTSTASDNGSGAGSAGSINLVGGSVHVTGGRISSSGNAGAVTLQATGTDVSGTPALLVDGGTNIKSTLAAGLGFGSGGSPGNIQLRADSGTVSVVGTPGSAATATSLDSSGSGGSAPAGQIGISGQNISLRGALINTLSNADSQSPGKVTLTATGDVGLNDTLIDTESVGFGGASGAISISAGGSVAITGGQSLSEIPNKTNVALFSGASNRAVAGDIVISAAGPVTISNSTFDAQALFLSQSGAIKVSGSGVLLEDQSLLSADYLGPGTSFAGGPGAVSIRATGTTAANDPLQADLTTATPGVVRIVDSAVTAINSGGKAGNIPGRGQVLIGTDVPGGSTDVTNNVVIAGSFISTDVLAGGAGNDLSITGSNGVWIGPSATGGYQGNSRSLISATTENTAISGGQIFILGGAGGVSIVSSDVDANDAVDGNNAGATRFSSNINVTAGSGGAVSLSDSVLTTETSGVNQAGNIVLSGSSVSITKGELSAASTASSVANPNLADVGDAGSVSVTASTGSLMVEGAIIQSDATKAVAIVDAGGAPVLASTGNRLAIPNAGTVTLAAAQGSIDIKGQAEISTAAGAKAGNAGAISFAAPNGGVSIADSSVTTNVASTWTVDTNGNAVPSTIATISAVSGNSGLSISNSTITADTSGTVAAGMINLTSVGAVSITGSDSLVSSRTSSAGVAGDLDVSGSSVLIDGANLTASTTGAGNAGSVSITASGATGFNGAAALQVRGGAILASDASAGQQGANAGSVELMAANGTVQVGAPADVGSAAPTRLSSDVGVNGGSPGAVTITGLGVDLEDAQIKTTTASTTYSPIRGSIVLNANEGAGLLQVSNSSLDAATSGVQLAGEIDLQGAPIQINNANISSATSGTGSAGAICVGSSCVPATAVAGGALASGGGAALASGGGAALAPGVRGGAMVAPYRGAPVASSRGGSLTVAAAVGANGISISGSKLSTSTSGSGAAGDITMTTPGALQLTGSQIESKSTATAANAGPVGVINLTGGSVGLFGSTISAISNGGTAVPSEGGVAGAAITIKSTGGQTPLQFIDSTVTTQAVVTNGSNIVVNAGGSGVKLSNSVITASAVGGNGGNITVNDAGSTALQHTAIVAQAGPGNGGAINIGLKQGAVFVQDSESLVSATSKSGNNGTVTINSPQTDLNSALRVPEVSVAHGPELTANVCRHEGNHSTFVKEGRGGVAADPQGYLPSTTTTTDCP